MSCNYTIPTGQRSSLANSWFHISKKESLSGKSELIVPDCTPGLMYIHRGTVIRSHQTGTDRFCEENVFLFGQKSTPVIYEYGPEAVEAYGVKLNPSAIHTMFDIESVELANCVINLDSIVNNTGDYAEALKSNTFIDCIKKPPPQALGRILEIIHTSRGIEPISTASANLNISYKQIERLFRRFIGITPKMYARIIRFNYSVQLGQTPFIKLTDLAYQSGYYDQNHFIKEVKYFTGKVPREVFCTQASVLENNQVEYLRSRIL